MPEESGMSSVKISKNAKGQKSYEVKSYHKDLAEAAKLSQAEAAKLDSSGQFANTVTTG